MSDTIKKFKFVSKKIPPIAVTLSKSLYDFTGSNVGQRDLILSVEFGFKRLVRFIRGFPFVALDQYPYSGTTPSRCFRWVKATSGPARMGQVLCEYKLSFHGDPKYWKWALIASGLVKK